MLDTLNSNTNVEDYFTQTEIKNNNSVDTVQYININPATATNKNITTIKSDNYTTTIISNYSE